MIRRRFSETAWNFPIVPALTESANVYFFIAIFLAAFLVAFLLLAQ